MVLDYLLVQRTLFVVVELLLAWGAEVNAKHVNGTTALMVAALTGQREVAELLLAKGADANAKLADGTTVLMTATAMGYREIAELLKRAGARLRWQHDTPEMTPR